MKISVSTLALYPKPFDSILTCLEDKGLEYCEVINEYPYDSISHEIIDSYNIKISVHAPLSDINIASHNKAIRESSISQVKQSIDMASELEPTVVVHPGSMPILGDKFPDKIREYNINALRECSKYAEDCGVRMCIENMPNINGLFCRNLNELEEIANEVDAYITLDVGHANNMGISADDMFKSKLIRHIHLSDNDGSFDNHNALGSANINFEKLFKNIKKSNYNDILVVEVKSPQEVTESLDYLKMLLKN
jgi:sugar phosphate isomerase/epimerase